MGAARRRRDRDSGSPPGAARGQAARRYSNVAAGPAPAPLAPRSRQTPAPLPLACVRADAAFEARAPLARSCTAPKNRRRLVYARGRCDLRGPRGRGAKRGRVTTAFSRRCAPVCLDRSPERHPPGNLDGLGSLAGCKQAASCLRLRQLQGAQGLAWAYRASSLDSGSRSERAVFSGGGISSGGAS